jgi:excisionase family DNA binding protein
MTTSARDPLVDWGAVSALEDQRPPRWATVAEAAAYARVSYATMGRWIRDGRLPSAERVGPRKIRVDLNDVDKLHRPVATTTRSE